MGQTTVARAANRAFLWACPLLLGALGACGGGGGGSTDGGGSGGSTPATGHILEVAQGATFETPTQAGTVAADGGFTYIPGEQVTFRASGIELATVRGAGQVSLVPAGNEKAATNMLRMLRTLDTDDNLANGVQMGSLNQPGPITTSLTDTDGLQWVAYAINPMRAWAAADDAQVASALAIWKSNPFNPAGTYSSFAVTGPVEPDGSSVAAAECNSPFPKPTSGTLTLSSDIRWAREAPSGSLTLVLSDGSTKTATISAAGGTIALNGGATMAYTLAPVASGSSRALTVLTSNAAQEPCSKALVYLRDSSKPNEKPVARVSSSTNITLPSSSSPFFVYNFESKIAGGPNVFGLGSNDPDGKIVSQQWTSSKGGSGSGETFSETISPTETVTFTLTVTDDEGGTSTAKWTVAPLARSAEESAAYVNAMGGLYGMKLPDDSARTYLKFDRANNRIYLLKCTPAAQYCARGVFTHDMTDPDIQSVLTNLRFPMAGTITYGDSPLTFYRIKGMPWGYVADGPDSDFLPLADPVAFSVDSGTYAGAQTLVLSTPTTNGAIRYTLDGSDPRTSATAKTYTSALTLSPAPSLQKVRAATVATGYKASRISEASYTINALPVATAPSFSVASGTYTTKQTVTLSSPTAGAVIRYTTDGSKPTPSSTEYTGPIAVLQTLTLRALAAAPGYADSPVAAAAYTIAPPPPPAGTTTAACVAQTVAWQVGSAQCQASYPGGAHQSTVLVVDDAAPAQGSAQILCSNGRPSINSNFVAACNLPAAPPAPAPARVGTVKPFAELTNWAPIRCTSWAGTKSTQYALQVKNETDQTVDIRLCYPWARSAQDCFVYPDVPVGGVVPTTSRDPIYGGFGPSDYECRSTGEVSIEWSTPDGMPGQGFGRAASGEPLPIEKELFISSTLTPYSFTGQQPIVNGTIRVASGGTIVQPLSPTPPAPSVPVQGGTAAGGASAPADEEQTAPDTDGCWVPIRKPACVVVEQTKWSGTEFIIRYRNNCPGGVYMGFCNARKDGTTDCGADHVAAGKSTSWWTYNATGDYAYKYTGSNKASSDWVCAGKDPVFKAQQIEKGFK